MLHTGPINVSAVGWPLVQCVEVVLTYWKPKREQFWEMLKLADHEHDHDL